MYQIHPCHSKNCLKSDQRVTEVTLSFSDFYWDRPWPLSDNLDLDDNWMASRSAIKEPFTHFDSATYDTWALWGWCWRRKTTCSSYAGKALNRPPVPPMQNGVEDQNHLRWSQSPLFSQLGLVNTLSNCFKEPQDGWSVLGFFVAHS